MAEKLTRQDKKFIETYAETGNGTLAASEAFDIEDPNYAGVKAHRLLRKDKIVNAIEEALPDDILHEIHREGLYASKPFFNEDGEKISEEADYSVRHKYLDTAYKLKGAYAAEKHVNLNIDIDSTDPVVEELTQKLNAIYKGTGFSSDGGTTSAMDTQTQDKE